MTPTRKARRIKYAAILYFISKHVSVYGVPPTIKELSEEFGSGNPSTAWRWTQRMEREGWIKRTKIGGRGYKVTQSGIHYMHRYRDPDFTWKVGEPIDVE